MRTSLCATVLLVAVAVLPHNATAQPGIAPSVEFVYARPGYPTIAVYVMGQMTGSGKWRVETGTPLLDLLAVARPVEMGLEQPRQIRRTTLRLYRIADDGSRRQILERELDALLTSPQAATPLVEGDLVEVTTVVEDIVERQRLRFTEVLGVVTSLTGIATLVISLVR